MKDRGGIGQALFSKHLLIDTEPKQRKLNLPLINQGGQASGGEFSLLKPAQNRSYDYDLVVIEDQVS